MPKKKEFTEFEYEEIVGLSKGDFSLKNITKLLNLQ
jgi:hypothetical protein